MLGQALIVKDPLVRGPLALYPVFSVAPSAPAYATGPEAEAAGTLRVAERGDGAAVPELTVHNAGALPLLLLEGETLIGQKQHRVLDRSVLVPPATAIPIAVSCVEQGRWGAPRASTRSSRHAPADLRRTTASAAFVDPHGARKQSAVWRRIEQYEDTLGARSRTSALEDAFVARDADVQRLVDGTAPLPDQCGVVLAIDGRVRGLDCFDKPETLAAYWDALCAGYALDAVAGATTVLASPRRAERGQVTQEQEGSGSAPTVAEAAALVDRVVAALPSGRSEASGLGTGRRFLGTGVVGHALEWKDAIVHLSAFVDETP